MFEIHTAPADFNGLSCIEERDFLTLGKLTSGSNNVSIAIKVDGVLDFSRAKLAIGDLILQHDALRTNFRLVDGQWLRQVLRNSEEWDVSQILHEQTTDSHEVAEIVSAFTSTGYTLTEPCLFRVLLLRAPDDVTYVAFSLSHLISDTASASILLTDFSRAYLARAAGLVADTAVGDVPSLADYAYSERLWLASDDFVKRVERLRALHANTTQNLDSPANKLGIAKMTSRPVFMRLGVFPADAEAGLLEASKRLRVSLPLLLMALGCLTVSRVFDVRKSIFTIQFAGRQFRNSDKMVGHFNVPLRLLVDLSDYQNASGFIKSMSHSWFQLLSQFSFIPSQIMDDAVVPQSYRKIVPGTLSSSAINLMPPASDCTEFAGYRAAYCPTRRIKIAGNICQLYFFFLNGKMNYRAISTEGEANLDELCAGFSSLVTEVVASVLAEAERAA